MEICKEIVQIFFQLTSYVINLIENIQLLFCSLNRDNKMCDVMDAQGHLTTFLLYRDG